MKTAPTVYALGLALLLAACSIPVTEFAEPAASAVPANPTSTAAALETEPPPHEPSMPIDDQEAARLMYALSGGEAQAVREAQAAILEAGDSRFIPVYIELFRAYQIGLLRGVDIADTIRALETLSGQSFRDDWPAWVTWYGATDIAPPPGFTGWKGQVLGRIDPGFAEFLQDDLPSRIRVEEIQWGGVVVDGIPALDNPVMVPAAAASYLEPEEPVFGLEINGDARAYPLRIMDWHEMANDVVGGVPVSLAYCTLCGAGIAFDGRAPDGQTYTFGSSGFLFRSNKLMYDRQTRTLWNQLTGEPVLGPLAGEGEPALELELLPVVLTSWEAWQAEHPDTVVLDIQTDYQRTYTPGAAYGGYFASSETMFPVWQRSDLLGTKDRIYALRLDGVPKAYPLALLAEAGVVNDTLADTPVVLVALRGTVEVDGFDRRVGDVNYEAGGEVRAYDRGRHTFATGPDPGTVLDEAGRSWQVTEDALLGPDGEQAPRLGGHLAYWFGWYTFFPQTLVYGEQ